MSNDKVWVVTEKDQLPNVAENYIMDQITVGLEGGFSQIVYKLAVNLDGNIYVDADLVFFSIEAANEYCQDVIQKRIDLLQMHKELFENDSTPEERYQAEIDKVLAVHDNHKIEF